tara:strand:- start:291 stop:578 length:288 start_codon:yes stop_codon:yes gene_type:complete
MFDGYNNTGKILFAYQEKLFGYEDLDDLCKLLELPIPIFMSYCTEQEPKRTWLVAQVNKFIRMGYPMLILIWVDNTYEITLGEVKYGNVEVIRRG